MKWILLVLLPLLVIAGCNKEDASALSNDAERLGRSAAKAAGNAKVAASVNTVLALRKGISMEGLHVESEGGKVTIGGWVRTREERALVIETVNGIRGVEKVIDQLRVDTTKK